MSTPTPPPSATSTPIASMYRLKAWAACLHDPVAQSTIRGTSISIAKQAAAVFRKVST